MRSSRFAMGMAAAMAVALSMPSTLLAHDNASPHSQGGSMMGQGMMGQGMMGQGGGMMDHCSQMMQGASSRPNEQWRNSSPPAGGQNEMNQ